jgi:hypothetical protein
MDDKVNSQVVRSFFEAMLAAGLVKGLDVTSASGDSLHPHVLLLDAEQVR